MAPTSFPTSILNSETSKDLPPPIASNLVEAATKLTNIDASLPEASRTPTLSDPTIEEDSASVLSDSDEDGTKGNSDLNLGSNEISTSASGYGTRSKSKRLTSNPQSSRSSLSRQSSVGEADSLLSELDDDATEKSEWDQLEEPLPSIDLPKLPMYVFTTFS
jgi:hypothetical protein